MNFSKVEPPGPIPTEGGPSKRSIERNPPKGEAPLDYTWISDALIKLYERLVSGTLVLIGSLKRAYDPNWWPKKRGPADAYGEMPYPYDVRPRSGASTDYLAKASAIDGRAAAKADHKQYRNNARHEAWES